MKAEEISLRNDGNILVSQLLKLVDYYTLSYTLKGLDGKIISGPSNNIINSPTVFWWRFLLPLKNTKFKEYLIVVILHAYMAKIQGKKHVRYDENVSNFYQVLESMGRK